MNESALLNVDDVGPQNHNNNNNNHPTLPQTPSWSVFGASFLCILEGRINPPNTALASLVDTDNDWELSITQSSQYYTPDQAHGLLQKHINALYPQSWQSYAAMTLSVEDDTHPIEEEEKNDGDNFTATLSTPVQPSSVARRHLVNANVQVTKSNVLRQQRSMFNQHYRHSQYNAVAASRVLDRPTIIEDADHPSNHSLTMTTNKNRKRKSTTALEELRVVAQQQQQGDTTNKPSVREVLPVCMHAQFMTHPKSLNQDMLYEWLVPNKHTFYMTEKTDGVRMWLLLTRDMNQRPVQALVDRGGRVWRLHAHVMQAPLNLYKDTLLDGELVWRPAITNEHAQDTNNGDHSPTVEFAVFDAIAVGGMKVAQMDFIDTRQPIVHTVCASITWRGVFLHAKHWRSVADVFGSSKRRPNGGQSIQTNNAHEAWMQQSSLAYMQSHHTDGWIIQHRALASIALPPSVSSGNRVAANLLCLLQNEIYGNPLMHHNEQMRMYTKHVVDVFKFKPIQTLDFWLVLVPSACALRTMVRSMNGDDDNTNVDNALVATHHEMCALLLSQEEFAHWTYDDYFARFQQDYTLSDSENTMAYEGNKSHHVSSQECLCGWMPTRQWMQSHPRINEWRSCLPIRWSCSASTEEECNDENATLLQTWIHEHFDIAALTTHATTMRASQSPSDICMPPVLVCGLVEVAVIAMEHNSRPVFQPLRVRSDKPSANGIQTTGNTVADWLAGPLDAQRLFIALSK